MSVFKKSKSKAARRGAKAANGSGAPAVRVARVPKGKRPQYFSDPAIDKLLWTTITLAQELAVTRDRLDSVERLLIDRKVLKPGAVDAYVPPPQIEAARDTSRAAFVSRILRATEAELTETGKDNPQTQDEVIAAVSQ